MAHIGPFWPEEVHFGPPTVLFPFLSCSCALLSLWIGLRDWVIPRTARSVSVRSRWADLGAQAKTCSAPQPQQLSGDPKNLQYFLSKVRTAVLSWEAYCRTFMGGVLLGFPRGFLPSLEARKVQRYKWGAYCRTNWRCTAVLSSSAVGVGVSENRLTIYRVELYTKPPDPRKYPSRGGGV